MTRPHIPRAQRGATLVVALIMLTLITLLVLNAFTLSSSNLKAVGNMQIRDEAVAAANNAVEQILSSNFTNPRTEHLVQVDINNDGTNDYAVAVAIPTCIKATIFTPALPSDVELGAGMSTGGTWYTDWDLKATVADAATGAAVKVRQGVTVVLSQAQKTVACP